MCGRFFLQSSREAIAKLFGASAPPAFAPRYNVAPTQQIPAVRAAGDGRECVSLRWGFIPSWSQDGKLSPINAMSETAADKPMFRGAFRKRRCLVPASGFYEWKAVAAKKKQPYAIRLADDKPLAFAGLWEKWAGPDGDVESCCILTTAPNELVGAIHNRMPVILDAPDFGQWLDPDEQDAAALAPLLRPFPAERMRAYPVSTWVNDVRHTDARCIEPAA
jgi:putative SOS response-associated peptidase YedK